MGCRSAWSRQCRVPWALPEWLEGRMVFLGDCRDLRSAAGHHVRAGPVKNCRAAELPESTAFAETCNCPIDHSLYKLSEGGTLRHMTGCIDSDIVSDHHLSDVCWLAYVTDRHVQVWRNGSVNEA